MTLTREEALEAYWKQELGRWLVAEPGRGWNAEQPLHPADPGSWQVVLYMDVDLGRGTRTLVETVLHETLAEAIQDALSQVR